MKEISEKLFSLAAENISRRSQSILNLETNKLQHKVSLYESELTNKMEVWEKEKSEYMSRIKELEKENNELYRNKGSLKDPEAERKMEALIKENKKLENEVEESARALSQKIKEYEEKMNELRRKAEENLARVQNERLRDTADKDAVNGRLSSEIESLKKELSVMGARYADSEKLAKSLRDQNMALSKDAEVKENHLLLPFLSYFYIFHCFSSF